MKDIDQILNAAGAKWRATQPAPPEPVLAPKTAPDRRPWLVAAAAAVATVAVVVGATVAIGGGSPTSRSTPGTAAPDQLLVRDGDTVEANGEVVAVPGAPVEFCPTGWQQAIAPAQSPSHEPTCGSYGIVVTGVDLSRLANREVSRAGAVSGLAVLRGVLHDSTIRVTRQSAPPPVPKPSFPVTEPAPCAPPAGGWQGLVDSDAVSGYVNAQPDRFGGMKVSDPLESSWDPVKIAPTIEIAVVGVAVGDVAQAQAELRARFGPNVCAIQVATTDRQQKAALEEVRRLYRDQSNGIYVFGGRAFTVDVEITYLNPDRYAALERIGLDALSLTVWLKPVR